jgi:Ca2+-binding EF-hand superfamily protein
MEVNGHSESPHLESPPPFQPPKIADETTFNDQINKINPGRLSIVCIQAANLRRKDKNESKTLLNPSIRFTLGPKCKTTIVKNSKSQQCMTQSPSFENEIISFDVEKPKDIFHIDENDIKLKIEVIDKSPLQDFVMGEVTISAMRFFQGAMANEWIPLFQNNDKSSNSSIHLQFGYSPVRVGMLMLTLIECKDLCDRSKEIVPLHTRAVFNVGERVMGQSKAIQEKGGNPKYHSERIYLDLNEQNWFDMMKVQVLNLTTSTNENFGEHLMNLLPLMNKDNASEMDILELPLSSTDRTSTMSSGTLVLKADFLHSSFMNIKVSRAKSLKEFDASPQKLNPYVVIKSEGRSSCPEYRSKTIREGGVTPVWEEDFSFTIVDHSMLSIECYDNDFLTDTNDLIGRGELSLLPAYRTGHSSTWVNLTRPNEAGAILPCGQVNIVLEFEDVGSNFPKLHESNTRMKLKDSREDQLNTSTPINSSSQPLSQEVIQVIRANDDTGEEFSDEDIRSTFSFLDLDNNGYVGAAELRHILINMGELITDEEVDTMISMVDMNGDGQINFQQFAGMARSTNLDGLGDVNPHHTALNEKIEVQQSSSSSTSGSTRLEATMGTNVDAKRRQTFLSFIINNKIGKKDISNVKDYFLQKHRAFVSDKHRDVDSKDYSSVWTINYETFTGILPIQATGESLQVFNLFFHEESNTRPSAGIDIRELTLSLCNFTKSYTVEERCSLMFELYDGSETGHIKRTDMKGVLAGTHLKSQKDVARKAQTVLKFVDKDGDNEISREVLLQAALKFPNLLLPKMTK